MKKATLFLAALLFLFPLFAFGDAITLDSRATTWDTKYEKIHYARATGASALAKTLAPGVPFRLIEVRIHLSAASATSENFTITMDSGTNAVHDMLLYSKDMNGVSDVAWILEENRYFESADELDFAWANTNTRTWGLELIYDLK